MTRPFLEQEALRYRQQFPEVIPLRRNLSTLSTLSWMQEKIAGLFS